MNKCDKNCFECKFDDCVLTESEAVGVGSKQIRKRKRNKESAKRHSADCYKKNKEKISMARKEYYQRNKEKISAKAREYYQKKKEKKLNLKRRIEMSKWNGKVRCLSAGNDQALTVGKVYEVKKGVVTYDDGAKTYSYRSFDDFRDSRMNKWEEVKEIEDLREMLKPCMLVKLRNGEYRIVMECKNCLILSKIEDSQWIDIADYRMDLTLLDEEYKEFDIVEVYDYAELRHEVLRSHSNSRKLIWKREEEKTPQQIEIEQIEAEQRKLADRLSELRKGL